METEVVRGWGLTRRMRELTAGSELDRFSKYLEIHNKLCS